MAYKKAEMIKQCLKVIKEHNLKFIEEIICFVPFSSKTFYNHELQEVQDIKSAIESSKVKTKVKLRNQWEDSDNGMLQVALYKIIGTDEEYKRLANARQEIDHTTKGEKIIGIEYLKPDENTARTNNKTG